MNSTIHWQCRDRLIPLSGGPLVMGILNVTPDSFSDGGHFSDADAAVAHGVAMAKDGAAIIDVGGESTRPGSERVSVAEELDRVVPVIRALAGEIDAAISVDTTKAEVAEKAINAGAEIINDVSALTHDDNMVGVAAESGAGVVLMHMRGTPQTMQDEPRYDNAVEDICSYLQGRVTELTGQGLTRDRMAIDPGIGFGKTVAHNVALLAGLDRLRAVGVPVVIGASRKSFLGKLTGRQADERLAGSLATLVFCALNGAHIVRVHDVRESVDAISVANALMSGGAE